MKLVAYIIIYKVKLLWFYNYSRIFKITVTFNRLYKPKTKFLKIWNLQNWWYMVIMKVSKFN